MAKTENKSIFTPERTVKFFIVDFLTIAIVSIIIWPLLDLLWEAMRGNNFTWAVYDHVISPVIFALLITIIEFIGWNFFHKESK